MKIEFLEDCELEIVKDYDEENDALDSENMIFRKGEIHEIDVTEDYESDGERFIDAQFANGSMIYNLNRTLFKELEFTLQEYIQQKNDAQLLKELDPDNLEIQLIINKLNDKIKSLTTFVYVIAFECNGSGGHDWYYPDSKQSANRFWKEHKLKADENKDENYCVFLFLHQPISTNADVITEEIENKMDQYQRDTSTIKYGKFKEYFNYIDNLK